MDGIGEVKKLQVKQWNQNSREIYSYRYVNGIPLRDSQPAIDVNWCELILTLLAFLFHTVLHFTDLAYQQIRHKRGTRKGFFQDLLSLTKYLLFESWSSLIDFMLYGSTPSQAANSS